MEDEGSSLRVNITCHVSGVFPHPDVRILVGTVPIRHDGKHAGIQSCLNLHYSMEMMRDEGLRKADYHFVAIT